MKKLRVFVVLALALLIVTAIGVQGAQITLRVNGFSVGEEEKGSDLDKAYQQFLSGFEQNHPNIKLEHAQLSGDPEQILAQLAAGAAPDVFSIDSVMAPRFAETGALLDLKQFESSDEFWNKFFPNVLSIQQFNNKTIGMPNDFTPMVVYYNKKIFDEAGVAYPEPGWTWNDFLATTKALTKDTNNDGQIDQYGFLVDPNLYQWVFWPWQNDGDVLSPDGTKATGYLNSPATVEAIQFYTDLVLKYHVAPTPSARQALPGGTWDLFFSGNFAMVISGHWSMVGIKLAQGYDESAIGVIGLPQNKKRVTVLYTSSYGIPSKTKYPNEAWSFIKEVAGDEYQRTKIVSGIAIPAVIKIAQEEASLNANEKAFFDEVQYGRQPWGTQVPWFSIVEEISKDALDQILAGQASVQKALDEAAANIDKEIAKAMHR